MKRLDEIPKKTLFEVPEGYFDRLPGAIQARISGERQEPSWAGYGRLAVRFALPTVVLVAAAFFYWNSPPTSAEEVLAGIDSEQLVAYLGESEMNTDDLLELIQLDPEEADSIEVRALGEFNLSDLDIEGLADEIDAPNN